MKPKKTSHFLHFLASCLFFPWVIMWVICHKMNQKYNQDLEFHSQMYQREFEAGKARNDLNSRSALR